MKHTCTSCGHIDEINPAVALGSMKKTMTPAAMAARKANAQKPRKGKRKRAEREAGQP